MFRRHRTFVIIAACVGVFPFVLEFLMWLTPDIGLIWLLFHQLYYSPLSGIGEAFFTPDSDVSFWVRWPGRVLAVVVYVGGLIVLRWGYGRWRARHSSSAASAR
jgi:hypothetical protein